HKRMSESAPYEWKNQRRIAKNSRSIDVYVIEANKGNPYALWEAADLLFEAERNEEAIECLMRGAKSNDSFIQSERQLQLGWRVRDGKGGQESDEKAVQYFKLAGNNKHPIAYRFLSEGYYYGRMGLKKSHSLARDYAERGAECNDPGCFHFLG